MAVRPEWRAAGDRQPRLLFAAHSMGGLVVRAALEQDPELAADTRAVITVGTPFLGSAKAVLPLNLLHALLATASDDQTVRIWNPHTRTGHAPPLSEPVLALAAGHGLLVAGTEAGYLAIDISSIHPNPRVPRRSAPG
ncbi:hypothetical protein ACFV0H_19325 [Streptomyces erythrochromogenes]|uniref:lipase/acyltransferase domain-containing protein n=1 Tax=Streptomyces erythrochromogenes TaxID=285574 RepID=UPI0036D189E2